MEVEIFYSPDELTVCKKTILKIRRFLYVLESNNRILDTDFIHVHCQ